GLAIAPDGTYALATNYLTPPDSYLAVVDIDSKQIKKKIPLDRPYPQSVYINPDGTLAWVTYPWNSSVEVIDILTGTLVQGLVIIEPFSIAFSPNGTRAYISSAGGSVQVIDTSTYRLIKSVPAGPGATDLQVTPDGAFVYANNSEDRSITVIETQSLTSTTQTLSGVPQGSALVPPQ
ncbi:MAG TPA: YncE family protein, partial [Bryobacteraceae bacterium]